MHAVNGQPLGVLCVLDMVPRDFPWKHYKLLNALALELETEIDKRRLQRQEDSQRRH